jgi:hypothetical protein
LEFHPGPIFIPTIFLKAGVIVEQIEYGEASVEASAAWIIRSSFKVNLIIM